VTGLRPSSPGQRRALKLATQRAVRQCGGQEVAAELTRVGPKTLSDYGNTTNPRHADTFIPVDVLLDLVLDRSAHGEVSPLLCELNRQAGGTFVPLPLLDTRTASPTDLKLTQVLCLISELQTALAKAVAEGLDAEADLVGLKPSLTAAIDTLCALRSQITNTVEAAE
jgi:hypothetical protein